MFIMSKLKKWCTDFKNYFNIRMLHYSKVAWAIGGEEWGAKPLAELVKHLARFCLVKLIYSFPSAIVLIVRYRFLVGVPGYISLFYSFIQ